MPNFKFELWEIENGIVITRPIMAKDEDGATIVRNASVFTSDPMTAVKEVQSALDAVKAEYVKRATTKR
jgi:hypothetical protein